jgi:Rrf2 family protein
MSLYGSNAEYALHCLLFLVPLAKGEALSARHLAECQGISPTLVAKLFTSLQRAGIVTAQEGFRGGFSLARAAENITVIEVIDTVEGRKKLFDCKEIRARCPLFDGSAPDWATRGVCDIHAAMLSAERAMRAELAKRTLADLARKVAGKMPKDFAEESSRWLRSRVATRRPHKQPQEGSRR